MASREILYIEDNYHNRRIVRKILERQGYTLYECEDGLEGYEMLRAMKPDVVLLDISLPSMDGMEIAGRVKADPELKHIYLLALTASAMHGDRERFLDAGCDDYMSKPFRALDLVEMVNKYTALVEPESPARSEEPIKISEIAPAELRIEEDAVEPAAEVEAPVETIELATESVAEVEAPVETIELAADPAAAVETLVGAIELGADPAAEVEAPVEIIELASEPAAEVETPLETIELAVEPAAEVESPVEDKELAAEDDLPIEPDEAVEEVKVEEPIEALLTEEKHEQEAPVKVLETVEDTEDEQPAETAELALEPDHPESAWALVTDEVQLQQADDQPTKAIDELLDQPREAIKDEIPAASPGKVEAKDEGLERPTSKQAKDQRSIDAIKAGIMGVINSEILKPVDPN